MPETLICDLTLNTVSDLSSFFVGMWRRFNADLNGEACTNDISFCSAKITYGNLSQFKVSIQITLIFELFSGTSINNIQIGAVPVGSAPSRNSRVL